jgi:intracellular multiplication protein IcmO
MDSRSASSEKRARIDLLDLKEQREGEAHIFFKSKIVRAKMFFANPVTVERMRINQFLKVDKPIARMLIDLDNRIAQFSEVVQKTGGVIDYANDESDEINIIADNMNQDPEINAIERSVSALLAFHNRDTGQADVQELFVPEDEIDYSRINLFQKVLLDADVKQRVGSDLERFSSPLLNRAFIKDKVELLERVLGRSGSQANSMTSEILKDMLNSTDYPPDVTGLFLPVEQVSSAAQQLADYVESLQTPPE